MWHSRRRHAAKAGVPFTITVEWLTERMLTGHCEVTGLPFDMSCEQRGFRDPWAPSVDRIDPAAGYTPDNCRMVVSIFNYAKNEWSDGDVLRMAKALCEPHGETPLPPTQ